MSRHLPEIILAAVQLLLLVTQYSPISDRLFDDPSASPVMVVPAQIAAFMIYAAWRQYMERAVQTDIKKAIEELSRAVPDLKVLRPGEFYSEFSAAIRTAQRQVAIAHLDDRPPYTLAGSSEEKYFRELSDTIIRFQANVFFRRVERATPNKREWLQSLIERYEGKRNFSLACIRDRSEDRHLPHISMQVIDEDKVFLVAIGAQSHEPDLRDIYIKSPQAAKVCLSYYNKLLWERSDVIVERGRVDVEVWNRIRREIGL